MKRKDGFIYKKGKIENSPENIMTFINNDPLYAGKIKLNTFTNRLEYNGKTFSDRDFDCIAVDVRSNLGFFNPTLVRSTLNKMMSDPIYQYNPVEKYLKSLAWDGNKRIEQMYTTWFKADDTRLNRAKAKKLMIAGVKRALEPGCKFDNVVILKGDQGIGKSIFCKRLSAGFGSVNIRNIDDPEKYVHLLNQSWICIIDELRGFTKKEQETIKGFLADTEDTPTILIPGL